MTEFSASELKLFENVFVQGGHVLDFNNANFRQFILKATNIDVHDEEYSNNVANEMGSASKGKTLTYFINNESEKNVLKLLSELIEYVEVIDYEEYGITLKQLNKAKEIINKHKSNKINIGLTESSSNDLNDVPTYSQSNHLNPPFHAYNGNGDYIFVSYAHIDANRVFPELKRFHNQGYPIWYDDGIGAANEWPKEIEDALLKSNLFVVFISKNAVESINVRNEINLAIDEKIPVITIYLENTELKHGLKLRLSSIQGILKFSMPDDEYVSKYRNAFKREGGFEPLKKLEINDKPKTAPTSIKKLEIKNKPKSTSIAPIKGLEKSDTILIKSIGDHINQNNISSLSFEEIVELTEDFDLTSDDVAGFLKFLRDLNYIHYSTDINGHPHYIKLTYKGVILYCNHYVDNFRYLLQKIFSAIINEDIRTNDQIIDRTKIGRMIVNGILDCLNDKHYIKMIKTMDGTFIIHKVSEKGKRYMKKSLNEELPTLQNSEILLPNCNKKETEIFKDLWKYCLDKSFDAEISPLTILNLTEKYYNENDADKLQEKIAYSLGNLEKNNYITTEGGSIGMAFSSKRITQEGFCIYLKMSMNSKKIYSDVIKGIFEDNGKTIEIISKKYQIEYSIVEALIKIFRKQNYIVCNNDLTDITLTPAGEEYFEEILTPYH